MARFVDWIQSIALGLGAPGLFLVAFLDSSFLSLPEIVDIAPVMDGDAAQVANAAVCDECDARIGRRMPACSTAWAARGDRFISGGSAPTASSGRWSCSSATGVMAVLIPSLLPPPAPFKIFVLLAGVAGISAGRFASAIAIGRGVRYFGEALLAVVVRRPGDGVPARERPHGRHVALAVAPGRRPCGAYLLWQKTQAGGRR